MSKFPMPAEQNGFLYPYVKLLRDSYRHCTGRPLVNPRLDVRDAARYLFNAPFAVAAHDTSPDPLFCYGNRTALNLFGMDWIEFTATPSRLSAEAEKQSERERLLERVAAKGFIDGYTGIRIGRHGRRFVIEDAVVWNLRNPSGGPLLGQAAMFKRWRLL